MTEEKDTFFGIPVTKTGEQEATAFVIVFFTIAFLLGASGLSTVGGKVEFTGGIFREILVTYENSDKGPPIDLRKSFSKAGEMKRNLCGMNEDC